jgi:hypothetical protein
MHSTSEGQRDSVMDKIDILIFSASFLIVSDFPFSTVNVFPSSCKVTSLLVSVSATLEGSEHEASIVRIPMVNRFLIIPAI